MRRKLTCHVTCGDCAGFSSVAIYSKPCDQLGVLKWAKPCGKFILDAFALNLADEPTLQLLKIAAKLKSSDVRRLAALLVQNGTIKRQGFRLGQEVVIPILSGEYVSNYARAILIGGNATHAFLRALTVSRKVRSTAFRARVHWESVLSIADWTIKKQQLLAENKLRDPKYEKVIGSKAPLTAQMKRGSYQPASITAKNGKQLLPNSATTKSKRGAGNGQAITIRDNAAVVGRQPSSEKVIVRGKTSKPSSRKSKTATKKK